MSGDCCVALPRSAMGVIMRYFLIMHNHSYISSKTVYVSHAKMIAVLCLLFELSPMNNFDMDIIYTWLSVFSAYH